MTELNFRLIGYSCGIAGADIHAGDGPIVMRKSGLLQDLSRQGYPFTWEAMITSPDFNALSIEKRVGLSCDALAREVSRLACAQVPFGVIGGDHTCAIGTWSGIYDALHEKGDFGLIWIDAHMDSHTPDTSITGRIHGMPLACLLGEGYDDLTGVLHPAPKLKPENICLIGVRSFEQGEADFLKRMNVRIFYMDEVKQRGFPAVLEDAVSHVSRHTFGYGISLDLDGIDPVEAPAVDVPEPDGIHAQDLLNGLSAISSDPRLIAAEIVEFDPSRDENRKTEKIIISVLQALHGGKQLQLRGRS
ncbi:Arginase [Aquicella siphonis]|uniref:Arginase n=1 Tax=Aquicella siphonis TaxID=254247 RepID=A0A5E4PG93_9COXI|nr:arginase [Aquicella siphonis]VVC76040.1 Arginase [Aquicella siphonis]